jgi:hypothetical protein
MISEETIFATHGRLYLSDYFSRLLGLGTDDGVSLTYHDKFVAIEFFKNGRDDYEKRETLGGCEIFYESFDPQFKKEILG